MPALMHECCETFFNYNLCFLKLQSKNVNNSGFLHFLLPDTEQGTFSSIYRLNSQNEKTGGLPLKRFPFFALLLAAALIFAGCSSDAPDAPDTSSADTSEGTDPSDTSALPETEYDPFEPVPFDSISGTKLEGALIYPVYECDGDYYAVSRDDAYRMGNAAAGKIRILTCAPLSYSVVLDSRGVPVTVFDTTQLIVSEDERFLYLNDPAMEHNAILDVEDGTIMAELPKITARVKTAPDKNGKRRYFWEFENDLTSFSDKIKGNVFTVSSEGEGWYFSETKGLFEAGGMVFLNMDDGSFRMYSGDDFTSEIGQIIAVTENYALDVFSGSYQLYTAGTGEMQPLGVYDPGEYVFSEMQEWNGSVTVRFKNGKTLYAPYPTTVPDASAQLVYEGESGLKLWRMKEGYAMKRPDGEAVYALTELPNETFASVYEEFDSGELLLMEEDGTLWQVPYRWDVLMLNMAGKVSESELARTPLGERTVLSTWGALWVLDADGRPEAFLPAEGRAVGSLIVTADPYPFDLFSGRLFWDADLYDARLEKLNDEPLRMAYQLPDGGEAALAVVETDGKRFALYAQDGAQTFRSGEYEEVLYLFDSGALVRKNGKVLIVDFAEKQLSELFDWSDKVTFSSYLSGYYEKTDHPDGWYFVFEYTTLTNGHEGFEYCFEPEKRKASRYELDMIGALAKPVLYLYPEAQTDVTVTFEHPEALTTVYPAYGEGWQVSAAPDGTLTDARGRSYYALYWEEKAPYLPSFDEGFCVSADGAADFLERTLAALGFTEREANEFIMYWLPVLERNGTSLVTFELTESREAHNALHISPEPDSLLRAAMYVKKVDAPVEVPAQKLPRFERKGFAAVEWGGRVVD